MSDLSSSGDSSPWHPDPLGVVGQLIGGRYRVEGCLSTGGMGAVYLATEGSRELVVKLMTISESADNVLRFQREASSLARIRHPNIVRIFDHGRCGQTGLLFIAMERATGDTLRRYLKLWGPCPVDEFLMIAEQLLSGVAAAHRCRVLHRDLKPANIMVSSQSDGQMNVTLLDFGLSKITALDDPSTDTHNLVGSPMYIAPEQLKGRTSDTRSDVYALGVLFYEMLTGRRPFSGKFPATVFAQQASGSHVPMREALGPREVPEALIALIERCLSPEPSDRPWDADSLRKQLRRAIAGPAPVRTHAWAIGALLAMVAVSAAACAVIGS